MVGAVGRHPPVWLSTFRTGYEDGIEKDPPTVSSSTPQSSQQVAASERDDAGIPPATDRSATDGVPGTEAADPLRRARRLAEDGNLGGAAQLLKTELLRDPDHAEVLFTLGSIEAARGRLSDAISLLDAIDENHPDAGLPALGQSADWCMTLERYDQAEERYRRLLMRVPGAARARRQLALLLNRQGRRQEAAEQVRELCKLGDVRQDELHSLVMLNHAMYDDPPANESVAGGGGAGGGGTLRYTPIGASGRARKLFTDGLFDEAAEAIHESVASGRANPAVVALYGRIVTEAQDDQKFRWWLSRTDPGTRKFSDYWAALGTYLISQRRFEEATRALLEAVLP